VRNSFTKLRQALELREKLLIRQLDVLSQNEKQTIKFSEINFLTLNEDDVLALLRNYGAYQNIDCYLPYLENENEEDQEQLLEKSFYHEQQDDGYKKLNDSIINMTLSESHDLITRSKQLVTSVCDKLKVDAPKNIQQNIDIIDLSNEQIKDTKLIKQQSSVKVKHQEESSDGNSKLKRNCETTSSKKKTLKNISNLTLNNCNGNIVLRNIQHLTINTCKQQNIPQPKIANEAVQPVCKTSKSCDGDFFVSPECDFYKRLINENEVLKNHIVKQSVSCSIYPDPIMAACKSPSQNFKDEEHDDGTYSVNSTSGDTTTNSSMMEEAEDGFPAVKTPPKNVTAVSTIGYDPSMEQISPRLMLSPPLAGHLLNHPPIIQCWLKQCFLETETEPQNAEFLEFTNIV